MFTGLVLCLSTCYNKTESSTYCHTSDVIEKQFSEDVIEKQFSEFHLRCKRTQMTM